MQVPSQAAVLAADLKNFAERLQAANNPAALEAHVFAVRATKLEANVQEAIQLMRIGAANKHTRYLQQDAAYLERQVAEEHAGYRTAQNNAPTGLQSDGADETTAA